MDKKRKKINTGLSASKKDLRPIKEKEFQSTCLKKVIKFLALNNYPLPISLSICQIGDLSIFRDVIDFLLASIDPYFSYTSEKELQDILHFLGYPYHLHSQMFSGASHYWGHLIALMAWVVDLIKIQVKTTEKDIFSEYFLDAYQDFMTGKNYDGRVNNFMRELEKYIRETGKECENLKNELKNLREKKRDLRKDVGKEIGEAIEIGKVQLGDEVNEMGRVEEEMKQIESCFEGVKELILKCFDGEIPGKEEFDRILRERVRIEEEILGLESEISELTGRNEEMLQNKLSPEEILEEYTKGIEVQEEIDDFRRKNAYMMEEIEQVEEDLINLNSRCIAKQSAYISEEQQLKSSIQSEYSLIISHTESITHLLSDLSLLNK